MPSSLENGVCGRSLLWASVGVVKKEIKGAGVGSSCEQGEGNVPERGLPLSLCSVSAYNCGRVISRTRTAGESSSAKTVTRLCGFLNQVRRCLR